MGSLSHIFVTSTQTPVEYESVYNSKEDTDYDAVIPSDAWDANLAARSGGGVLLIGTFEREVGFGSPTAPAAVDPQGELLIDAFFAKYAADGTLSWLGEEAFPRISDSSKKVSTW